MTQQMSLASLVYFYCVFLDVDDIVVSVISVSEDCQSLQAVCVLHHHHLVTTQIPVRVHHHQLVCALADLLFVSHLQLQPRLTVNILL